jgi:transglutaminase-like putative cysteine protease
MQNNIEQEPVDVFTALDVLSRKKAECQGHTYLYAAFARSLGIPTRVVNGIVYSQHYSGFLYHAWAESLIGDHWITVDPTLVQLPADATHIKFVEGESFLDLMPMVDLVGRLQVQIIAVDSP